MIQSTKPPRESIKADENLCDYCSAKCCKYFALPIEEPTCIEDFEFIRWYILHDGATVFTEDDTWYLLVHSVCKELQPDNRCGIYQTRPKICRDYSTKGCEYEDNWTYDRYFETPEQVAEYIDAMFTEPSDANFRSPKPADLPILA